MSFLPADVATLTPPGHLYPTCAQVVRILKLDRLKAGRPAYDRRVEVIRVRRSAHVK